MRRAAVLLLALTACAGETVLTPSPSPTTAATEVVASTPVTGTDGPGATTTTPEPEPVSTSPPAEQSGDVGDVQRQASTTAPPSTGSGRSTTTIPAASIANGPLPVVPLPYNGWAIPEYIVSCETGGTFDWMAYNTTSGASGPYQLMWFHLSGDARTFPRAVQHAKAAELWDGGRGWRHWRACV